MVVGGWALVVGRGEEDGRQGRGGWCGGSRVLWWFFFIIFF